MKGTAPRIVSGLHKGRKIETPEGRDTRPTAARAREGIFDVLTHRLPALREAIVLDAFAGSGAMGLEAISRGAARALFIENDPPALKALQNTIRTLGVGNETQVVRGDATNPPSAPLACSIAFLDPPYHANLMEPALLRLAERGWLRPGALVICEHGQPDFPPPPGFESEDERKWGKARVSFLRYSAA